MKKPKKNLKIFFNLKSQVFSLRLMKKIILAIKLLEIEKYNIDLS